MATILNLAQIKALSSPVRHRLLGFLETGGPMTSRKLAMRLGMSPESIYYHLKKLQQVDLIREVGMEATARRDAKQYDLVARSAEVKLEGASPQYRDAYAQMSSALVRWAGKSHAAAVRSESVRQIGADRERSVVQFHVSLRSAAVHELNAKLTELEEFLDLNQDPDGDAYVVTCVVAPIA